MGTARDTHSDGADGRGRQLRANSVSSRGKWKAQPRCWDAPGVGMGMLVLIYLQKSHQQAPEPDWGCRGCWVLILLLGLMFVARDALGRSWSGAVPAAAQPCYCVSGVLPPSSPCTGVQDGTCGHPWASATAAGCCSACQRGWGQGQPWAGEGLLVLQIFGVTEGDECSQKASCNYGHGLAAVPQFPHHTHPHP